jgi:NAD(P)-dependent dehydrogenase (short-subunit alcohol dehydrogenase family)
MSLFDLTGRVAVITGSSRGIGRAAAERLAEQGACVVVSSRKLEACRQVADSINARHESNPRAGKAIAVEANISSKEALQLLVERAREAFGRIDILVCNAATNVHFGSLATIKDEQFRKIFENNVLANHWLIQMAVPEMIARRDGVVVIVSSIGGLRGSAMIGAYNVSKAADFQLARNLAVELGPHNIRVNCVAPGIIRTDFAKALWSNPKIARAAEVATPLRRLGEPDDVAGVIAFLAAPAARYITGQEIIVDGGSLISTASLGES